MAQIFKVSGYLVDCNDEYDKADIDLALTEYGCEFMARHLHVEQADIGDWNDDNPLNYAKCDLAECEKYFHTEPTKGGDRYVMVGATYRHFKEGKLVKVLAVSQDTENVGSFSVVYECKDKDNNMKIWHRPYDMFISEVDHLKYPDATQKYRFEKVEEN